MPGGHNKRDEEIWSKTLAKVDEKFEKKNIISWTGRAITTSKGEFEGIVTNAPKKTKLEEFFQREDIVRDLTAAAEATFFDMWTLDDEEVEEQATKQRQKCDEWRKKRDGTKEKTTVIKKPLKPVMSMNTQEMEEYFPALIETQYDLKNVKVLQKWGSVDKETGESKGPQPPCPNWNPNIIVPEHFHGPKAKYIYGNILWRMKLQAANILLMNKKDPDTYCEKIPKNYVPKKFSIENIEAMGMSGVTNNNGNDRIVNVQDTNEQDLTVTEHLEVKIEVDEEEPESEEDHNTPVVADDESHNPENLFEEELQTISVGDLTDSALVDVNEFDQENVFDESDFQDTVFAENDFRHFLDNTNLNTGNIPEENITNEDEPMEDVVQYDNENNFSKTLNETFDLNDGQANQEDLSFNTTPDENNLHQEENIIDPFNATFDLPDNPEDFAESAQDFAQSDLTDIVNQEQDLEDSSIDKTANLNDYFIKRTNLANAHQNYSNPEEPANATAENSDANLIRRNSCVEDNPEDVAEPANVIADNVDASLIRGNSCVEDNTQAFAEPANATATNSDVNVIRRNSDVEHNPKDLAEPANSTANNTDANVIRRNSHVEDIIVDECVNDGEYDNLIRNYEQSTNNLELEKGSTSDNCEINSVHTIANQRQTPRGNKYNQPCTNSSWTSKPAQQQREKTPRGHQYNQPGTSSSWTSKTAQAQEQRSKNFQNTPEQIVTKKLGRNGPILTPGWLRKVFNGQSTGGVGLLQFLGFKRYAENENFQFKMNDSTVCVNNILGADDNITEDLTKLPMFSIIKVTKAYTIGFKLYIESFIVKKHNVKATIKDSKIAKIGFLDEEFFKTAHPQIFNPDGTVNADHSFFKEKIPTVRTTRSKSKRGTT